eukprot:355623-Chlamydomonas_euryale.AAC.12
MKKKREQVESLFWPYISDGIVEPPPPIMPVVHACMTVHACRRKLCIMHAGLLPKAEQGFSHAALSWLQSPLFKGPAGIYSTGPFTHVMRYQSTVTIHIQSNPGECTERAM